MSRAVDLVPGSIGSVTVVAGHAAAEIEAFLDSTETFLPVKVLHNPEWAALNNWFSLLLALRAIGSVDGRVLVMNADLVADPRWFAAFIVESARTEADALIAVDTERTLTSESMKVAVARTGPDENERLHEIAKIGVDAPVGEYVGMLSAEGSALRALRSALESFVGQTEAANEWYERAVALTAASGQHWTIWATPDSRWVEIDDLADHALACKLIAPS
jgi:choline kinase